MLLERRDEVARVVARAAGCAPDRARARELDAEIRDLESRLDVAGERVLAGSWRDQQEHLARVPVDVLKDRLARAAPATPTVPEMRPAAGATAATFAVGAAILLWGVAAGRALLAALGAALAAVAAAASISRSRQAGTRASGATGTSADDGRSLLEGLRLQPAYRGRPGESLVSGLTHLQSLLHDRAERIRALASARARVDEVDSALAQVARELGLVAAADSEMAAQALDAELRRAERAQEAATQAQREARRLLREKQSADASLAALDASIAEMKTRGAAIATGDPGRGLEAARARIAAHRRADELEAELERSHPDLAELRRQIAAAVSAPDAQALDPHELATARARLDSLEEEIERLARRAEALDQNVVHLRDMETVDAVDSEIAALREDEARLARERDRKWVLARLLREADRRFREEHQPDLLRRASAYLAHLTGDRYERLIVDETEGGHLFRLVGRGLPTPVALAGPISTGTLEQAYLALRLAIVDHLDRGSERLPLFVDEVFVNWDGERRDRGLEVLAGIAATRQVFAFTCHPGVADELARRGGRVLSLGQSG